MSNKKDWINKYFPEDDLKEIQRALDDVEKNTSGQIIMSLRSKKTLLEKLYSHHELAIKDFDVLGVANTRERTGIMIFIIFEERYYDIIADEGIFAKISDDVWNKMEETLKEEFRKENYSGGILTMIGKIGEVLSKEFPTRAGSANDDEIEREIVIN